MVINNNLKKIKMKNILFAIAMMLCLSANSQSFDGVYIGGSASEVASKLRSKGYKQITYEQNFYTFTTIIEGEEVEVYLIETPETKKAAKIVLYFPKREGWNKILNEYMRYANLLKDKYGVPYKCVNEFTQPYFLGDGYELQALKMEKCNYGCVWLKIGNMNIEVEISKYVQLKIAYENEENMTLNQEERKRMLGNKF